MRSRLIASGKRTGYLLGVGLVFLVLAVQQSRSLQHEIEVELASWEIEVSRDLLLNKSDHLLSKLKDNLQMRGLQVLKAPGSSSDLCWARFEIPFSLYGVQATRIEVCQPPLLVLKRTLLSGPFVFFLVLAAGTFFFVSYLRNRHRLQTLRMQSQIQLQEELAKVARQVAHDIRAPLGALDVLASLSHDAESDQTRLLRNSIRRIRGIADDLLKRGRATLDVTSRKSQIEAALEQVIRELRMNFPEQKIQLIPSLEDFVISGHADLWQRIFQNLILNSCEAHQQNGETGPIEVQFEVTGLWLQIQVRDRGLGLSKEALQKIGTEGWTQGKEEGSGLGVSFVKSSVLAFGGQIQFENASPGLKVTLRVPIHRVQIPVLSRANA